MARPIDDLSRYDIDVIRSDDLSFEGRHGRVGVTLYLPSVRQVTREGEPEILCPYSAGWGEGLGAAQTACEALTQTANVLAVAIEYPKRRLDVSEILDFRTEVYGEVIRHLRDHTIYDFATTIVVGYSRGSAPARLAAVGHTDVVTGICFVAPTWFSSDLKPHELATRGLAESAGAMSRSGWHDRINLISATARLVHEMVTHPWDLRNDIAAISQENAADLDEIIETGLRVGVVGGIEDELCDITGIRQVIDKVTDRGKVDYHEVHSDHFSYFMKPDVLRVVAEVVNGLASSTA
ncbi:MAG: hypothetical protein CSA84_02965 [Actinomycetales bacterium]|nr:MAG: hypothetical protein CSA84_02965 [Actinomycetales bacterium]